MRYRFRIPGPGEPGYENNRGCSTTTNQIAPGDKCHRRPVRWKIARTADAKAECAAPFPEAP